MSFILTQQCDRCLKSRAIRNLTDRETKSEGWRQFDLGVQVADLREDITLCPGCQREVLEGIKSHAASVRTKAMGDAMAIPGVDDD